MFGGAAGIIGPGRNGVIRNTEPLVIGQYYYIVMDGGRGDNCDWTFEVLSGDTKVDPLTTSGPIEGNFLTCPDVNNLYRVLPPVGGTEFLWELNGEELMVDTSELILNFAIDGIYTLCVTTSNACDEAPPTCTQILVQSIPDTDIFEILCDGDCLEVADTTAMFRRPFFFPFEKCGWL